MADVITAGLVPADPHPVRCAGCGAVPAAHGRALFRAGEWTDGGFVPCPGFVPGASSACREHGTLPPPGETGCRLCADVERRAAGCGCSDGPECGPWRERYGPVDYSRWGYPTEQQNRAVALVSCAMDTGGHEDPLIDRAAALMLGDDDVDDPWDAYVRAADGMTPCPSHSDPDCTAGCQPDYHQTGVWHSA